VLRSIAWQDHSIASELKPFWQDLDMKKQRQDVIDMVNQDFDAGLLPRWSSVITLISEYPRGDHMMDLMVEGEEIQPAKAPNESVVKNDKPAQITQAGKVSMVANGSAPSMAHPALTANVASSSSSGSTDLASSSASSVPIAPASSSSSNSAHVGSSLSDPSVTFDAAVELYERMLKLCQNTPNVVDKNFLQLLHGRHATAKVKQHEMQRPSQRKIYEAMHKSAAESVEQIKALQEEVAERAAQEKLDKQSKPKPAKPSLAQPFLDNKVSFEAAPSVSVGALAAAVKKRKAKEYELGSVEDHRIPQVGDETSEEPFVTIQATKVCKLRAFVTAPRCAAQRRAHT
jgi:hypothetical protein